MNEVSSLGVRALMATRPDSSENWVTNCSAIGKGNPMDTLPDSILIVQMIWEPSKDKT